MRHDAAPDRDGSPADGERVEPLPRTRGRRTLSATGAHAGGGLCR